MKVSSKLLSRRFPVVPAMDWNDRHCLVFIARPRATPPAWSIRAGGDSICIDWPVDTPLVSPRDAGVYTPPSDE